MKRDMVKKFFPKLECMTSESWERKEATKQKEDNKVEMIGKSYGVDNNCLHSSLRTYLVKS